MVWVFYISNEYFIFIIIFCKKKQFEIIYLKKKKKKNPGIEALYIDNKVIDLIVLTQEVSHVESGKDLIIVLPQVSELVFRVCFRHI